MRVRKLKISTLHRTRISQIVRRLRADTWRFSLIMPFVLTINVALGDGGEQSLFGVAIRNSAIEQRFTRTRNEQQPVAKVLLNSEVTGQQTTVTETRIRFLSSQDGVRFEVISSGDISSQTTGINRQAMVESSGQQHFEAIKPFWFDGNRFLTKPAYGTIQASQTPQRVVSAVGARMPALSRVGDRIAWNQVVRRGPEINTAVAEDVSRDVFPKVDQIVDNDFAALGQQWTKLQKSARDVMPSIPLTWTARSGDSLTSIWVTIGKASSTESFVPRPVRTLDTSEDVAIFVSEETVDRILAQYVKGGMTLSDNQLQQLQVAMEPRSGDTADSMVQRLQAALRSIQEVKSEPTLFSVELPSEKPLQVKFRGGDIRLVATFQVHPKLGAASGWMTTSFNFRGKRLSDREWTMAVRGVDVNALDAASEAEAVVKQPEPELRIPVEGEKAAEEVTTVQAGTAWSSIIQSAVEGMGKKIPEVPLPLEFPTGNVLPGAKQLRIVEVDSDEGVLRCSFGFR